MQTKGATASVEIPLDADEQAAIKSPKDSGFGRLRGDSGLSVELGAFSSTEAAATILGKLLVESC